MLSFTIVPVARPDLALTLVTDNGAAALALLPKQPGNPMQQFEQVPAAAGALLGARHAEDDASPHALLARAGSLSGMPTPPADAVAQAHILDFVVALAVSLVNPQTRLRIGYEVVKDALHHRSVPDIIVRIAHSMYGIDLDEGVVARFVNLLKQKTPNKQLAAFFKSAKGDKATMAQIAQAGNDYAALAKVCAAHGVAVSASDLQSYLGPWQYYTQVLDTLKSRGVITQAKYDEAMGYKSGDYQITGEPNVDQGLIAAWLSATSYTTKLPGFGDFALPMQALMIPFATAAADSLDGTHNFQFKNLGPMMVDGVFQGLQATADGLQSFGNDVSSIF